MSFQNRPYSTIRDYKPILSTILEEDENTLLQSLYPPLPIPRETTQTFLPLPPRPDIPATSFPPLPLPRSLQASSTREAFDSRGLNYPNIYGPVRREFPTFQQEQSGRRSLYDVLQGVEVDNKPWRASQGIAKYGLSSHPDLANFLGYVNNNPNATQKDIQQELDKCTTQNCAENTFFGLTKMNARTKEGSSPRSELERTTSQFWDKNPALDKSNYPGYFPLGEALGIKERDPKVNASSENRIPQGTTVFMQHPNYKPTPRNQEFPFDHVFYSQRSGRNTSPIYRHLNAPPAGEPPRGSIVDTLQDIIDKGNYNGYRTLYSNKWRVPEEF